MSLIIDLDDVRWYGQIPFLICLLGGHVVGWSHPQRGIFPLDVGWVHLFKGTDPSQTNTVISVSRASERARINRNRAGRGSSVIGPRHETLKCDLRCGHQPSAELSRTRAMEQVYHASHANLELDICHGPTPRASERELQRGPALPCCLWAFATDQASSSYQACKRAQLAGVRIMESRAQQVGCAWALQWPVSMVQKINLVKTWWWQMASTKNDPSYLTKHDVPLLHLKKL